MTYEESTIQAIIAKRGYRENIKGDKFSLFISNYPANAQYLKSRIGNPALTLAELCCSIGVTLEYLAPGFKKVIGVDIDKGILETCSANLKDAGLLSKAELIHGDVFEDELLRKIKADIVIYDIPYWYKHTQQNEGDLRTKNPPLKELINKVKEYITPNIIIFAPPEWSYEYFRNELGALEFEQVFIQQAHDRNQVYLGDLIKEVGITSVVLNDK